MSDFSGIFDDLSPDDFFLETSAIAERDDGPFYGTASFDAHIEETIRNLRVTFSTSVGRMNPIAILSNRDLQRTFTPQQDEDLGMFLERLKREARLLGASWFFFAKRNVFVLYDGEEDEELHDVTSSDSLTAAQQRGGHEEQGIVWFAERREVLGPHTSKATRQGVLHLSSAGDRIVGETEGDERQTIAVFSGILDAVTPTQ